MKLDVQPFIGRHCEETLANIKELKTTIIKEPDAKTQSR